MPAGSSFDTQTSPEQQMNKLREQARDGGRSATRPRFGGVEASSSVKTEEETVSTGAAPAGAAPVTLDLMPDANDKDMEELLGILQSKGFKAVLDRLDRLNNPHLEDDFHRLLVQYKAEGHTIPGLKSNDPRVKELARALDFILLEVHVPELPPSDGGSLSDIASKMEQWYQGVLPALFLPDPIFLKDWVKRKNLYKDYFAMELAVAHAGEEAVFYMAVPHHRRDIFEKQLYASFPRARIKEEKNDYNIFNQFGATSVAYATLYRPGPLPLKTLEHFSHDPLNLMLSSFGKITKEGEGAAVQFVVANVGEYHMLRMYKVLDDLAAGKKATATFKKHQYLPEYKLWRKALPMFKEGIDDFFKEEEKEKKEHTSGIDQAAPIQEKVQTALTGTNIRIVASARTKERADAILEELESAFGQFENLSSGNYFKFRKPKGKAATREFIRSFIFRTFDKGFLESAFEAFVEEFSDRIKSPNMHKTPAMPINLAELSSMMHWAISGGTTSREARTAGAKQAPAVPGLPENGILIGNNRWAGTVTPIHLTADDRLRHLYTIGQTGTGKTNFLKNMIIQDIENGDGVCFIDPHGVDVQEILSRIPKSRYDDVIYFDPAHTERPMGLNMLEYDPRYPEQKTFVVDEMFKIFQKLYGAVPEAFGPIFEQYFRNAAGLVVEDPETGSTLLDISRVLSDEEYRHLKLSRSRNPVINHFWEEIAEQVRGEGDLRNVVPYITSKFDIFIANEIMRPVVGQQRSAFNFKDVMDNKKILLVNLSKGRLGDINANLLGLVIVGKILMTALGRSSYLHTNPPPFYLYLDEFQNVTTDSIAIILSEARKYKLSLTIAHQFIGQLSGDRVKESIKAAVFGNVGSMAAFRVGPDDAKFLETQYGPTFTPSDMIKIENFHAYVKILAGGRPTPPFSMETIAFQPGDFAQIEALKQMSYQRYGRPREAVEAEIAEKYQGMRRKPAA